MRLDPSDVARCVNDDGPQDAHGAAAMSSPIVLTSLYRHPSYDALLDAFAHEHGRHVYSRGQNPTVEALEAKLAFLERGEACKCFGSGMAAVSAVLHGMLGAGDHIVFVNQTYGPTLQLARYLSRFGVSHDVVLDDQVESVERALRPETRIIWMESPGTMLMRLLDIRTITSLARARGIATCIDNSWATPLLQKPIELGVDLVVHSATKYLGGHSDLVAGALIGRADRLHEIFHRSYLLNGGILGAFEAWLVLRGMRTLPVRLAQHEVDGLAVAEFLRTHKAVRRVFHPAFDADRSRAEQLRGFSGLMSFELKDDDFEKVRAVMNALRVFRIGVSWGGVESIAIAPNRGTNKAYLAAQEIPRGLIRISVGLEGSQLLIEDLERALASAEG
jgi:cystathionine beta-lyase/cystathionine gamma-synthase